jgi:hypothetical protein
MVLLSDEAQVEARFSLFGDSVSVSVRSVHGFSKSTISPKIVFDARDDTTR